LPKRGNEILRIISAHGPITIDIIQRLTSPEMPKRNIRRSLQVLRRKGIVDALTADIHNIYYQTSQLLSTREHIAEKLEQDPTQLQQPLFSRQKWPHNQWCEYWIALILRLYPEAEVIREYSIANNEIAKRVLGLGSHDYDLMPDILLAMPGLDGGPKTYIAFEIERTRKSDQRIIRKLTKYMSATTIDGLIYICDSARLSETIRLLYQSRLATKSMRIGHYRENFFLFSDSLDGGSLSLNRLFNAKAETVRLQSWITLLGQTKWTKRRDSEFKNL
jgi:predicted transcriptional regulator